MNATDTLWSCFEPTIVERLSPGDDSGFWQTAVEKIVGDAEVLCRRYQGKDSIFAQIGSCSHWMSPHNKGSWFSDSRFARPTGYGCSGFSIYGLPEFDWSLSFEWQQDDRWTPAPRVHGRRPLVLRVALPARTAKHIRAVANVYWTPGSPTIPEEKALLGYAFRKANDRWGLVERVGGKKAYE
jgi:hypothetical protein